MDGIKIIQDKIIKINNKRREYVKGRWNHFDRDRNREKDRDKDSQRDKGRKDYSNKGRGKDKD